jgi:predicted O-methyltransferase YrrM
MHEVSPTAVPSRSRRRSRTVWESKAARGARVRMTLGALRRVLSHGLRPTFAAAHVEWTVLVSEVDAAPRPSRDLIEVGLAAARRALDVDLSAVANGLSDEEARFLGLWPGEHYRLLAALVDVTNARQVVEIGTFRGLGSAAIAASMQAGRFVTYDVIPISEFDSPCFPQARTIASVEQRIGDLSDVDFFMTQKDVLRDSDIIFIDGPKDGRFEQEFTDLLIRHVRGSGTLLVYDDIRFPKMVGFWRRLPLPKLDITSFGHYTGTGLVRL